MKKLNLLTILIIFILSPIIWSQNVKGVSAQGSAKKKPITLNNVKQLAEITTVTIGSAKGITISLSSDGETLAVADDGGLQLITVATGKMQETSFSSQIFDPVFSPDGKLLSVRTLYCSSPGNCGSEVSVLDVKAGQMSFSLNVGVVGGTTFSPDGKWLAYGETKTRKSTLGSMNITVASGATVHILDLQTQKDIHTINESDAVLGAIFFSPDGSQLFYNSRKWDSVGPDLNRGKLYTVDTKTGKKISEQSIGGYAMGISPNGKMVLTVPYDELQNMVGVIAKPEIIDIAKGTTVMTLSGEAPDVAFSSDSQIVAIIGEKDQKTTVSIRELSSNKEILPLSVEGIGNTIDLAISADGTRLALVYRKDGTAYVKIWGIP